MARRIQKYTQMTFSGGLGNYESLRTFIRLTLSLIRVKRLLREHSYGSLLFQSAKAFQDHDDFDEAMCIVLDIQLDGESGIEVRYRLTIAGISLPVIYITANDSDTIRAAALESGCLAYLTKPFPAKSLIEPIERAAAGLA